MYLIRYELGIPQTTDADIESTTGQELVRTIMISMTVLESLLETKKETFRLAIAWLKFSMLAHGTRNKARHYGLDPISTSLKYLWLRSAYWPGKDAR